MGALFGFIFRHEAIGAMIAREMQRREDQAKQAEKPSEPPK